MRSTFRRACSVAALARAPISVRQSSTLGLGRRKARLSDERAWIFNRMAAVYDARPAYPAELIDALQQIASPEDRILDIGAGIGHLAVPLSRRGLSVAAIEPARAMLDRLRHRANEERLPIEAFHATAESLPLPDVSFDVAIIADALHFLDAELTAKELARVLKPKSKLALVTVQPAETSFMNELREIMHASAPRRTRDISGAVAQIASLCNVSLEPTIEIEDSTPVSPDTLMRILGSISFIGPAMNETRAQEFRQKVLASKNAPVWSRKFVLRYGMRR